MAAISTEAGFTGWGIHTRVHKTPEAQDGARAGKRRGGGSDGSALPTLPSSPGADF